MRWENFIIILFVQCKNNRDESACGNFAEHMQWSVMKTFSSADWCITSAVHYVLSLDWSEVCAFGAAQNIDFWCKFRWIVSTWYVRIGATRDSRSINRIKLIILKCIHVHLNESFIHVRLNKTIKQRKNVEIA